jgi:hypothetical protein
MYISFLSLRCPKNRGIEPGLPMQCEVSLSLGRYLAAKPGLGEELKTQTLKLETPYAKELEFELITDLARWASLNALGIPV